MMLRKYAKSEDGAYWLFAVGILVALSRLTPFFPAGLSSVIVIAGIVQDAIGEIGGEIAGWVVTLGFAALIIGLSMLMFKRHPFALKAAGIALALYILDSLFLVVAILMEMTKNPDTGFLLSTFLVEVFLHAWVLYCLWAGFAELRRNPPRAKEPLLK